mgnify:FL=1
MIKTGPGQELGCVDPLNPVQKELDQYEVVPIPDLPRFHGGAVGYLAYDVVHYFEPSVPIPDEDMLTVPQSLFMFSDTLLVFDHIRHDIKVVSHVRTNEEIERSYNEAVAKIDVLVERLSKPLSNPPKRVGSSDRDTASIINSNFTRQEYSDVVTRVKEYVSAGDVIQAVTSQRFTRKTSASPFQIYRTLRTCLLYTSPSPRD